MKYRGTFNQYIPSTLPDGMPPEMLDKVVFIKNEFNEDLYELRKILPKDKKFLVMNDNNIIRIICSNPDELWPANGGRLYECEVSEIPTEDPAELVKYSFDEKTLTLFKTPVIIKTIKRHQGLLALLLSDFHISEQNIRDKINLETDNIKREVMRIKFESPDWERNSEFITWGKQIFNLNDTQINQLFQIASTL